MSKSVVITSATRTAIGSLGKSLKNISGDELGSTVIKETIQRSKITPGDVDEVIMGQVLTGGTGQNPARQAAMKSDIPKEKDTSEDLQLDYSLLLRSNPEKLRAEAN